jgi:clan AA aspartic protease
MGMTRVPVTVRNIAEPDRSWTGLFVVDTGATDSMVPREFLEAIGLSPLRKRTYRLGDGRSLAFDITEARLEFMGKATAKDIIMGGPGSEPLLGVTALESTGMEVDPVSETLKELPAVRLVGIRVDSGRSEQETAPPRQEA